MLLKRSNSVKTAYTCIRLCKIFQPWSWDFKYHFQTFMLAPKYNEGQGYSVWGADRFEKVCSEEPQLPCSSNLPAGVDPRVCSCQKEPLLKYGPHTFKILGIIYRASLLFIYLWLLYGYPLSWCLRNSCKQNLHPPVPEETGSKTAYSESLKSLLKKMWCEKHLKPSALPENMSEILEACRLTSAWNKINFLTWFQLILAKMVVLGWCKSMIKNSKRVFKSL